MSLFVCLPGVPPVTVNMEVDVLSRGAPSTVTAPTAATEEPHATAVSNQPQSVFKMLQSLKYSV